MPAGTSRTRTSIQPTSEARPESARAALAVAALGVVFGDLGTSPLYTLQECLSGPHGVAPTNANVLGVLSLIFWSLTMVVTVKYLFFLMRADNEGEGGIMALLALAPARHRSPAPGKVGLISLLVIAGAALLFGDGIITPAVSVLSAVEGLGVAASQLKPMVVPLTVLILIALFAAQNRGTAKLGRLFGPVMLLWCITIAVLWGLAGACIALVLLFRESGKLAAAFGLAVSGTMAITSIVYFFVVRHTWRWPLWKALAVVGLFLSFDIPFLVANALKFFDGGYLPFGVGLLFVGIMVTWRVGRGLLGLHFKERAEPLDGFIASLDERLDTRRSGTVVFMASTDGVPPAMRRTVDRFRTLHETVVLLTIVLEHAPRVAAALRVQNLTTFEKGFRRLTLHYGFMEEPDIHRDLALFLPDMGINTPPDELLYVVGRETFVATGAGRMGAAWESVFAFLSRNAKSATDYFRLPPDQVVEVGAHIDL